MTDTIEKITAPSRRLEKVEFEEEKPEPVKRYFMFPQLVDQLRELRLQYEPEMDDISLDNFMRQADPKRISKKILNMVRVKSKNNGTETKEYVYWSEEWIGFDRNGHRLPSVSKACGYDYQVNVAEELDSKGQKKYVPQDKYKIYLVVYSPETFDEIIAQAPQTDISAVGYICQDFRSWGGFSHEEFRLLPFKELAERGRTGKVRESVPEKYQVPVTIQETVKKKRKK